jgi:proline iminopeptidase
VHIELLDIRLANVSSLPDGQTVEWEASGSGPPLLWVEGGPGFPAHLGRPDVALFNQWFRGHLVNAPGCGRTSPPRSPNDYDLPGHVAFFEAARRAIGLGPLTLAGHSWGGLVAMAYAALVPEAVERVLIVDGYAGGGSVTEEAAAKERERCFERVRGNPWFAPALAAFEDHSWTGHTEQACVDAFAPAWPLYFVDPTSSVSRPHVERLARELRSNVDVELIWEEHFEAHDHRDLAGKIQCPVLVVVGEHDFICGPVWATALADAIPGSRLVEVPGVGHFPQYEAPDQFTTAIAGWLDETRLPAPS